VLSPLLTTIIGIGATILALSILVQVLQELYKHLANSKSRLYVKALWDHIGSLAQHLAYAPEFADIRVRGSFQILRRRPAGRLLPLSAEQLKRALERTSPAWVQRMLRQLRQEVSVSSENGPNVSQSWLTFLKRLSSVPRGATGYSVVIQIAGFLRDHGYSWEPGDDVVGSISVGDATVRPAELEQALVHRFTPHVEDVIARYDLLREHHQFAGRRRNLRQTFAIGFVASFLVGLPIQQVYVDATTRSAAETMELAEKAIDSYERVQLLERTAQPTGDAAADATAEGQEGENLTGDASELKELLRSMVDQLSEDVLGSDERDVIPVFSATFWQKRHSGFWGVLWYIFGCAGSAVLVSFGAPFWNGIVKALLGLKRSFLSNNGDAKGKVA